jgi:glucan 1,3-beta-glucosidase
VAFDNSPVAVASASDETILAGGTTVAAWGQGHRYAPQGPEEFRDAITPNTRPAALLAGDRYYTKSRPQYEDLDVSSFSSARDAGAVGDGAADDTAAIQRVINEATAAGKVVFLDYGLYRVTDTITVPPGARIFGESYPVIMGNGAAFQDMNAPKVVFKIGAQSGQAGRVDLSNFIVSTKGPAAGAIVVEYNLASTGEPSHLWDFHTRIGGYAGSEFLVEQCLKAPGSDNIDPKCISAYMAVHVTPASSGLYMENTWIWFVLRGMQDGVLFS